MKKIIYFLIFLLIIGIVSAVDTERSDCKPPIQYSVNNNCKLSYVSSYVNYYQCGEEFIYGDCEGGVLTMTNENDTFANSKKALKVGIILLAILLFIIGSIIGYNNLVVKKEEDEDGY